jgi:ABC-type bacteriocin/lantibiotic exporter with double-glycine peptidase domain
VVKGKEADYDQHEERLVASPAIIEPIIQKSSNDCCVACLAMLLGQPYKDVYQVATNLRMHVELGMTNQNMIRVAKEFGVVMKSLPLTSVHPFEAPYVTGILSHSNHAVILFENVVFNPADGLIYDPDAYIASRKRFKPARLLVI